MAGLLCRYRGPKTGALDGVGKLSIRGREWTVGVVMAALSGCWQDADGRRNGKDRQSTPLACALLWGLALVHRCTLPTGPRQWTTGGGGSAGIRQRAVG